MKTFNPIRLAIPVGIFSVVIAGVTFLSGCKKEINPPDANDMMTAARRTTTTATRYPLAIPTIITNNTFTLTAAEGTHNFGPSSSAKIWQYNGSFPGPTIMARKGDVIKADYRNNLPEPSIIHWHGMLVDHHNDGQPMQVIPPNTNYQYDFPILNRAAMNWYHPHPHFVTGKQVYNGLAGAFIIRDTEEDNLKLPSGKYEVPLVIRDITLDKAGNPIYSPTGGGYFGKIPLVNGTRDSYLAVDKAVYRFRVLIGSTSRVFKLALSNNAPFTLIGNDGGLLPSSSTEATVEASPGERLDLLVDFSGMNTGDKVMLRDLNAGWDLTEFRVGANSFTYTGAMQTTSTIETLTAPVRTRLFSFDGMSKINGKIYNMDKTEFTVPFGETEMWTFKTNGNGPHPVHIHGASFQIVNRTGGRGQVYPWEKGWKDVVLVNDFETVDVLIRFDAYKGMYVMHCHKLEHEDNGMMMNFEVQ